MFFIHPRGPGPRVDRCSALSWSISLIKLENVTLRVKQIRGGRYGDFCVGELFHDCCELKVKDSLLDQFEEGEYHGTVWISKIFLHQYIACGKAVTEMRATLHDMQLDSASDVPEEPELLEPDPLLESPSPASRTLPRPSPVPDVADPTAPAGDSTGLRERLRERISKVNRGKQAVDANASFHAEGSGDDALHELPEVLREFWDQIRNLLPVKLDPTVDRSVLREQTKALSQLGNYQFGFQDQTWYPK